MLDKPKILKQNKLFEEMAKLVEERAIRERLDSFQDEKLKKEFISRIDNTLHHKMNFFKNKRKPDPLAKQLVASLEALKDMNRFKENVFPPNLIFLDSKLKKEQIKEFIERSRLKILPKDNNKDKSILHLEMKSVTYLLILVSKTTL
jgi:hypothetical protein